MGDLSRFVPSWTNLLIIPGIIAGFTIHELAHTFVAYLLGDRTQVDRGRITLNPLRHISWFGTLTFIFFGFGWARPIQVDPRQFKSRYAGLFLVAISGAAGNLLLAGLLLILTLILVLLVAIFSMQSPPQVFSLLLSADSANRPDIVSWAAAFTTYSIYANLALAFFNLLPFPTLDGFTALASLIGVLRGNSDRWVKTSADSGPTPFGERPLSKPGAQRPADIHFELGAQYHAAGEYENAIARYRQAIANDSHYGPAYVNLGLAHLALDQRAQAIRAFRGATQRAYDEKSRNEAWAQLHKLSEFQPLGSQAPLSSTPKEGLPRARKAGPWTHTSTTPDWLAFGLSGALALMATGCMYVYLAIGLIRYLS